MAQVATATPYVAPTDMVSAYVNVRAQPTIDSDVINSLVPGMSAPLVSESDKWFAIELPDGITGYVSRYWTEKVDRPVATAPNNPTINTVADVPLQAAPIAASATTPGLIDSIASDVDTPAPSRPAREQVPASASASTQAQAQSEIDASDSRQASAPHDRSVLNEASDLLKQNRPREAYALLSGLESKWAGDTGFDYVFGVAALDSGNAVEAIFALERLARSLPDFVGARLELARALYLDGDTERAEQAFTALLDEQPPEQARDVIQAYLDAIAAPSQSQGRPQKLFYAAAVSGYNSNANGAADIDSFFGFTLDPRSTETGSVFVEARFGGLVRRLLRPSVELSWQGELNQRHNLSASFADQGLATTALALGFRRGTNTFITGLSAYAGTLDGDLNNHSASLDLSWQRPLRNNALQLSLRAGPVRFDSEQKIRNIDRLLYTLTLRQPIQNGNGELRWNAIGGRDRADDRRFSPYSNTRIGGQLSARWRVTDNDLRLSFGLLQIPFNGNRSFFGIEREDQQITSAISLELRDKPFLGWTLIPSLNYVNNKSNVEIFDYDRIEMNFMFRVSR